jgi:hypothetical protein
MDYSEKGPFERNGVRRGAAWPSDGNQHALVVLQRRWFFAKLRRGWLGSFHLVFCGDELRPVDPEAEAYFAKKGCKVLLQPTPEAIRVFNSSHAKKIGLFHVTC